MAVENPLDKAAELAKNAGEGAAGLLGGIARFLEQVTGDAFTAAVFAAMLLFTLSLIRGAAGARNPRIYITTITIVGLIGIVGVFVVAGIISSSLFADELLKYRESYLLHRGLNIQFDGTEPSRIKSLFFILDRFKWYAFIFCAMLITGIIMKFTLREKRPAINKQVI